MCSWKYRGTHLNKLQVGKWISSLVATWPFTLDRTKFMALLPSFNGAIQCGSGGAIGVHERLEESVPQDDP